MQDEDIKKHLKDHPEFFEQHASFLAEIHLPSPHGSGTISLAERQQLAQRDKIRVLEVKLGNLIEFAKENDATSDKVHAFSIKLLHQAREQNFNALQTLIAESMQHDFAVTQTQLHIWLPPTDSTLAGRPAFKPVNEAFSDWCTALTTPFCGEKPAVAVGLIDASLLSNAFIPLYNTQDKKRAFGVLVLGSKDSQRFKKDMGTMYLERAGDLISTALAAYL
ncbi:MAG: DUF484 family protein [Methylotenera sp.]|nr:DUF484 family protein [Methylotenera sp.]